MPPRCGRQDRAQPSAHDAGSQEKIRRHYLDQLLTDGLLERTLPDKPKSRLQKYRLTEKGRAWLAAQAPERKR
jgi:predicted transcriptional regulator